MLKKLSTFVLIGLIGVTTLAACGSDDGNNDAEPTVTRVPATNAPADQALLTPTVAITVTAPPSAATPISASPIPAEASPITREATSIPAEASPITREATPAPAVPSPIVNPLGTPGSTETTPPASVSPVATVRAATETATAAASPIASPAASPQAGAASATALSVTAGDLFFDPKTLSGAANTDVVITITNNGALAHDFSLPDLGITSKLLNPGESTTVTVNAPAGDYRYICTVPGHAEAGMVGTLTIS